MITYKKAYISYINLDYFNKNNIGNITNIPPSTLFPVYRTKWRPLYYLYYLYFKKNIIKICYNNLDNLLNSSRNYRNLSRLNNFYDSNINSLRIT